MRLHQRGLFFREAALLAEQGRKFLMDLTNVVKQGSRFDLLDLSGRQAQLDGNRPRKLTDTNGVARCVWISRFDGFDHQLKEFLTAVLKLMIQSVHVPNSNHWQNYAY